MDNIYKVISKMSTDEKALAISFDAKNNATSAIKRLKIDSLTFAYGSHGVSDSKKTKATCFPELSSMGRTWNPKLIKKTAQAIAEEASEKKISMLFAPNLNIKRSLRSAGGFSCFSEDPYLCAELGSAFTEGLDSRGIGACLKFFSATSYENKKFLINNIADERALREIYLYAFEQILTNCAVWGVMTSADKLNGVYTAESQFLLTKLLREEWNFEGIACSDICSVRNLPVSINAGTDLIFGNARVYDALKISEAVKKGSLSTETLDKAVGRLFNTILKAKKALKKVCICDFEADHTAARYAAQECPVLLKNENSALPLKKHDKLAVIGSELYVQAKSRESVNPTRSTYLGEEIKNESDDAAILRGYSEEQEEINQSLAKEAYEACRNVDKIIFIAGAGENALREGRDRDCLRLPEYQSKLIRKLARLGKPLVVLISGEPVITDWDECADSLLLCGFLGQAGARAVSDILFGKTDPSGRLAETIPLKEEDMYDHIGFSKGETSVSYSESIYVGYRYYVKANKRTAYPFGYGLSYTDFDYSEMKVTAENQDYKISIDITNTGERRGSQVIQIYVGECEPKIFKPAYELKGFKKVWLEPGETKRVEILLNESSFRFFDMQNGIWNSSPGKYNIYAATSSEHIIAQKSVDIFYGTVTQPVHTKTELPSYYNIEKKLFTVPHLEFESLLGYAPEQEEEQAFFTLKSTVGEIKESKAGRDIINVLLNCVPKTEFTDITDIPLESIIALSGGAFSEDMAKAALKVMNGDKAGYAEFKRAYKENKLN